jgi:integrase
MSNSTQEENAVIDFNSILYKCLYKKDTYPDMSFHKMLMILSITTGLEMELIMRLRWKDLLMVGSDNDTEAKKDLDDLKVRKYLIPIHKKVGALLSQIHANLNHPKLDSNIVDEQSMDYQFLYNFYTSYPKKAILDFIPNALGDITINKDLFYKIDVDTFTRKIFGRRVLEVNGYSNQVSKQLKNHFRFKTNKELFDFLGYLSSEEIKYDLSIINFSNNVKFNLDEKDEEIKYCNEFIKLEDKNFYGDYPFQKFSAFSKFMISKYIDTSSQSTIKNSIWLLLLMSLHNGVRISKLLDLKWRDIIIKNETEASFEIASSITLDNYTIKIQEVVKENLFRHFQKRVEKTVKFGTFRHIYYEPDSKSKPQLDSPVFITNTGNALTQNSLSREINSTLKSWAFPHADKFTSKSPLIMWGRRIIEIRGDHKPTIKALKQHFNFKSQDELFKFLCIDYKKEVKGKMKNILFEEILYDL